MKSNFLTKISDLYNQGCLKMKGCKIEGTLNSNTNHFTCVTCHFTQVIKTCKSHFRSKTHFRTIFQD